MTKEAIVITLKLKTGEDILGFYCGESDEDTGLEPSILLMRPIKVKQQVQQIQGTNIPVFSYMGDLYSLYGSPLTYIPYSLIVTRDVASDFFSLYYQRTLGNLLALEDRIQESYISSYDMQDVSAAMGDTDSIYVATISEFVQ